MSGGPSLSGSSGQPPMPDFPSFYRAINGREPFPWQARLAEQVEGTGEWPTEIGVPTGLGKTACLDIAVWWLASQADRTPTSRSAPTRIWWVVNRRLLVDSTARHACEIATALREPEKAGLTEGAKPTVTAVADRLRSLCPVSGGEALEVIRLRGGVETLTPSDPSRPAVILSTLPMYGSRLLFRGYGSSRRMRPIDAAMAGTDSLVLLDEAHLAPHLQTLCAALEDCAPRERDLLSGSRSRPRVVALTATGRAHGRARFDLDDLDLDHPVVRRRLEAPKPTELRECEAKEVAQRLAGAMCDLLGEAPTPAAGIVFANTPKTARAAFRQLCKSLGDTAEVLLSTGRAREREAERIREKILDPVDGMASGREVARTRRRHLVVVATQTLEVGADLDAEYLVTENCGVRALTQRLGRLNRLGHHPQARAIYLHAPPPDRPRRRAAARTDGGGWPVYRGEPEIVWNRLREARAASASGVPDLCPGGIQALLGDPADDPGRSPEILFGLLWEWIKTTTPPHGEAPVEPYFSGIAGVDRLVSLIWRTYLPEAGGTLWPRPRDQESVSVPISEIRDALNPDGRVRRIRPDRLTVEEFELDRLRPGDSLVLPSDRGLLDEFGWEPSSSSPVADVSLVGKGLPLDTAAIGRLCGDRLIAANLVERAAGLDEDGERLETEEQREAANAILETLRAVTEPPGWKSEEWSRFVESLSDEAHAPRGEVARLPVVRDAAAEPRSDEVDEMSLTDARVTLDRHGKEVAERARAIADGLGVPTDIAAVVERAGLLHDIGKADERFQRWLARDHEVSGPALAKSNMPRHLWAAARADSGWPRGGRHEALSARLVERWLERDSEWRDPALRDLLLHLVVSHHGNGRPLVPPVTDDTPAVVCGEISGRAVEVSSDLSEVDWAQPARFRRLNEEYGPWGLALLEAVVRLADHAVSGRSTAGRTEAAAR